jgi:hypothetical protein
MQLSWRAQTLFLQLFCVDGTVFLENKEEGNKERKVENGIKFNTGWFSIIVGVSVAYNFQTGNNKIKLLMEYENVLKEFYLATLYSPYSCLGGNMSSYL